MKAGEPPVQLIEGCTGELDAVIIHGFVAAKSGIHALAQVSVERGEEVGPYIASSRRHKGLEDTGDDTEGEPGQGPCDFPADKG